MSSIKEFRMFTRYRKPIIISWNDYTHLWGAELPTDKDLWRKFVKHYNLPQDAVFVNWESFHNGLEVLWKIVYEYDIQPKAEMEW